MTVHNEREQAREIAVLYTRHECAVLAERAGEQHRQLRARDRRAVVGAVTRDRLVLCGFAQRGVVASDGRAPYICNNRSFRLVDIAVTVLTLELTVESRVRRVAGNNER